MILVAIRPNMKPDIQKKSPDQSLSQYWEHKSHSNRKKCSPQRKW
jgi:hypothetical protein